MLLWFLGYVMCSLLQVAIQIIKQHNTLVCFGRRKIAETHTSFPRFPKKPDWVTKEIIRMKAFMPQAGCRQMATTFNRRFAKSRQMTVGKTWVSTVIQKHHYEIQIVRQNIKHRIPKPIPKNLVWGVDLTGKTDTQKKTHNILGIVEHASRGNLCLSALKDKASITLLHHLLDTVEQYGKPKFIRTDNESCFTSKIFEIALWVLGIKHQRIDKGCPWMNGRVERFFGTLKDKLNL